MKIHARNIDLNDDAEDYVQKKFHRLERHLRPLLDARLEVSRTNSRSESERVVAQLTLQTKGHVLRGQKRGLNLYAAIDSVVDVMDRQIRRYKTKFYRSEQGRRAGKEAGLMEGLPELDAADDAPTVEDGGIVRTKRFPMRPMSVDEAITKMDLLSHTFFLFHNIETDLYSVVYRREDGDYGLIEATPA